MNRVFVTTSPALRRGVRADGVIGWMAGIEALAALAKLKLTPLESIPEAQLAALRARGIEITSCH